MPLPLLFSSCHPQAWIHFLFSLPERINRKWKLKVWCPSVFYSFLYSPIHFSLYFSSENSGFWSIWHFEDHSLGAVSFLWHHAQIWCYNVKLLQSSLSYRYLSNHNLSQSPRSRGNKAYSKYPLPRCSLSDTSDSSKHYVWDKLNKDTEGQRNCLVHGDKSLKVLHRSFKVS